MMTAKKITMPIPAAATTLRTRLKAQMSGPTSKMAATTMIQVAVLFDCFANVVPFRTSRRERTGPTNALSSTLDELLVGAEVLEGERHLPSLLVQRGEVEPSVGEPRGELEGAFVRLDRRAVLPEVL